MTRHTETCGWAVVVVDVEAVRRMRFFVRCCRVCIHLLCECIYFTFILYANRMCSFVSDISNVIRSNCRLELICVCVCVWYVHVLVAHSCNTVRPIRNRNSVIYSVEQYLEYAFFDLPDVFFLNPVMVSRIRPVLDSDRSCAFDCRHVSSHSHGGHR